MELSIYQADAFTDKPFKGNPAAVVPLQKWLPDETLQNIALENSLPETAFFVQEGEKFHLRWFTPTTEVDLCGHATLASAFILFSELKYDKKTINFTGRSGDLFVTKTEHGLMMDFPVWEYKKAEIDEQTKIKIIEALGKAPMEIYSGYDWIAHYDDPKAVIELTPDMEKLYKLENMRGILATAQDTQEYDFISRFFAPRVGIPEDPVTGSAHCVLTPFWSDRLGKTEFNAYQASSRGGRLHCKLIDNRVEISGQACLYMKGKIYV